MIPTCLIIRISNQNFSGAPYLNLERADLFHLENTKGVYRWFFNKTVYSWICGDWFDVKILDQVNACFISRNLKSAIFPFKDSHFDFNKKKIEEFLCGCRFYRGDKID